MLTGQVMDLELFFEKLQERQKGLEILQTAFTRFGLTFNIMKTKTINYDIEYENEAYPESIVIN